MPTYLLAKLYQAPPPKSGGSRRYVTYYLQSAVPRLDPDSNFSLQQVRHGKSASLKQVIANDEVTSRRTCNMLVASDSLQTIAKAEYADEPCIRTTDNSHPNRSP
ncbi:hypothetical protein AVEN_34436-1 [Araneus ventricosus]|uniref:Uncharacterized protein n=1 Tax=Araneus ventricosus TaxID=182803 RepID=A0A4Y2GWU6_ARAVE|nr:hypothetical protein AVEN_34436-1 [Araneus ventricosus]